MEEVDTSTECWFTGRLAAWVRVNIGVRLEGMRGGFCLRLEGVMPIGVVLGFLFAFRDGALGLGG